MKALRTAVALAFALGLAASTVAAQQEVAAQGQEQRQIEVTILGMSCPFCVYGVQQKLQRLEGVEDLKVDLSTGLATLTLEHGVDVPNDLLLETVDEAGFEVAKIVRNFESEFSDWASGGGLGSGLTYPASVSAQVDMSCIVQSDMVPIEGRASPIDSLTFRVAGQEVKICYGRPSARGRTMIGTGSEDGPIQMGEVPFGKIWRTGANEATLLRTPIALSIAGVAVPAGTYSIYTVPGPTEWEIIVNRSYSQWGMESFYTDEVKAEEVGRGTVSIEQTQSHVEMFTIRAEDSSDGSLQVILEWERTRVPVPVSAGTI